MDNKEEILNTFNNEFCKNCLANPLNGGEGVCNCSFAFLRYNKEKGDNNNGM